MCSMCTAPGGLYTHASLSMHLPLTICGYHDTPTSMVSFPLIRCCLVAHRPILWKGASTISWKWMKPWERYVRPYATGSTPHWIRCMCNNILCMFGPRVCGIKLRYTRGATMVGCLFYTPLRCGKPALVMLCMYQVKRAHMHAVVGASHARANNRKLHLFSWKSAS
jgi:hypothetical protein